MDEAERGIVHRFRVQPGLNVAIEDSHNILLEVERPDGSEVIIRSGVLSNIDDLKNMLDLARVWVNSRRMTELGRGSKKKEKTQIFWEDDR